jgi:hypothetical protein
MIFSVVFGLIIGFFYFFPSVLAKCRHHRDVQVIMAINLFLGWTLIGWFVALIWAETGNEDQGPRKKYRTGYL